MSEATFDIPYAFQSHSQALDIYLPETATKANPVIVWLHPGGFNRGDKEMVAPVLPYLLEREFAVVSVNYRLSGEARFPAQIHDAKAAIRWVRANASRHNIDGGRVAAWGISAGSNLAALLGTTGRTGHMEDLAMGNPDQSSHVDAVVSLYGPMNFLALDPQRLRLGMRPMYQSETSGESQMFGGTIFRVPEMYRLASPINYVNPDCSPFFIQHGKSDDLIPYLQSIEFAGALEKAIGKDKVTLHLIENAGHFDMVHTERENVAAALDFLDKHLR